MNIEIDAHRLSKLQMDFLFKILSSNKNYKFSTNFLDNINNNNLFLGDFLDQLCAS